MQEQVNAINHNISSVSFHSIYKSLTHSWLEWFFSKSGNSSQAFSSSEANSHLLARLPFLCFPYHSTSHLVFLALTAAKSLSMKS